MIIFHNHLDAASRAFIERHGSGNTVISWYEGGHEAWVTAGGTPCVGMFPSVLFDIPAYKVPEWTSPDGVVHPERIMEPVQKVHPVKTMEDVEAFIDDLNHLFAVSTAFGMPVEPLTLDTIDRSAGIVDRTTADKGVVRP